MEPLDPTEEMGPLEFIAGHSNKKVSREAMLSMQGLLCNTNLNHLSKARLARFSIRALLYRYPKKPYNSCCLHCGAQFLPPAVHTYGCQQCGAHFTFETASQIEQAMQMLIGNLQEI